MARINISVSMCVILIDVKLFLQNFIYLYVNLASEFKKTNFYYMHLINYRLHPFVYHLVMDSRQAKTRIGHFFLVLTF